jgi:L-lactate dehydrogenase complex protein LldE
VDQFYPRAGIAAVTLLERLGVRVHLSPDAVCCGQPPANAGFAHDGDRALARFVSVYAGNMPVVVLSGSCALHVCLHAAHACPDGRGAAVAARTTEFCAFLHDVIGVQRVAVVATPFVARAAVHLGCHGLRGLNLATPTELQGARVNKVVALLEQVPGLGLQALSRPDECCGFGGTFAMGEPALSVKMGRDRLRDVASTEVDVLISPDLSCLMHLDGLARASGRPVRMLHPAEVLAGMTEPQS